MKLSAKCLISPLIFSWLFVFLVLCLILKSGLSSDDLTNFQSRKCSSLSFHQYILWAWDDVSSSIHSGRLTPLTYCFMNLLYWVSGFVLQYKILLLLFNLTAVYTFTMFLKSIYMYDWIPTALMIYAGLVQFYVNYDDSYSSLHAMYPVLAIFIMCTMISFNQFLKSGSTLHFILSLLLLPVVILYSESGAVIFPLLILLLLWDRRPISSKIKILSTYMVIGLTYAIATLVVRSRAHYFYQGVQVNFDPAKMWFAFYIQFIASIPLCAFIKTRAIPILLINSFSHIWILIAIMFIVFVFFFISVRGTIFPAIKQASKWFVPAIGLTLWIIPAAMIMVSSKYQGELRYGSGYLPVYIQNFGVVLVLISFVDVLFNQFQRYRRVIRGVVFFVFFCFAIASTLLNNYKIEKSNRNTFMPSALLYQSLKNGLLSRCEPGSTIAFGSDYICRGAGVYQDMLDCIYSGHLHAVFSKDLVTLGANVEWPVYLIQERDDDHVTLLYRLHQDGTQEMIKSVYGLGKPGFSFFDLLLMRW